MTFATSFGQTFFISIFAPNIMAKFDLSDGDWGSLYAIGTLFSGILMIFAGSLSDQFRVRLLGPALMLLLACFCLAMSVNPYVGLLPVIIFGLRFCGQGMLFHVAMVGMARWFSKNRGKAISVSGIGFSLGEAFLPLIIVALLHIFSWNMIWSFAALCLVIFAPLTRSLLNQERNPIHAVETSESTGLFNKHWTRGEALKDKVFWLLTPLILAPSAFGTALFFQQAHTAEVKGWKHIEYASLFPVYTFTLVISMLIAGVLIDRFGARRILPFVQLPMALGFLVLGWAPSIGWAAVAFMLLGLMQGAWSTTAITLWAELYGTRHLGAIKSAAHAIMVFGSAIGPWITGELIDKGIDFPDQTPMISAFIIAASILAAITIYKTPA